VPFDDIIAPTQPCLEDVSASTSKDDVSASASKSLSAAAAVVASSAEASEMVNEEAKEGERKTKENDDNNSCLSVEDWK
jgi:hypothetical protein